MTTRTGQWRGGLIGLGAVRVRVIAEREFNSAKAPAVKTDLGRMSRVSRLPLRPLRLASREAVSCFVSASAFFASSGGEAGKVTAKPRSSFFLPALRWVWHWENPHVARSR